MGRIDHYPTHEHAGLKLRRGRPFPLGASFVPGGINFSIYSSNATACTLVLYRPDEETPYAEIPFAEDFRIGNLFAMTVFDIDYETTEYGYRFEGPWKPEAGHRFDPTVVVLDPYTRRIGGREVWGEKPDYDREPQFRSCFQRNDFEWEHDRPPNIPIEDLIIYEMHVRGFTRHPSSAVKYPGTFAGIREKIPYLKSLGVNCLELMPIFEFDEFEYSHTLNPLTNEPLRNYWGYSTTGFFALKAGYGASGRYGMQADEFKSLVKELHQNGIEVILDVVFNHTSEGGSNGPTICFRGIDNRVYYMLDVQGRYLNYSGTGNTVNCNHPVVRELVIDSLRYWVSEYHIDGFRFDLASILGRAQDGMPLVNPPLLEALAYDPILAETKLIAEAWDAGGLYQVGSFPAYGRWVEWNGKFRSTIRRWVKGDSGLVGEVAQRLAGSPDLYANRGPAASINFITAHDGFTLRDLFSYNDKHNLANGEDNRDGANDNDSWNCGAEGPTDDPTINALRERLMRNAIALLMVSQGIPMILMGDEVGHSHDGNNNMYCHDTELNWFNWGLLEENTLLLRFFQRMIAFRHAHPVLRRPHFITAHESKSCGVPDLSWHGAHAWEAAWEDWNRTLAFMLCGQIAARPDGRPDESIYVGMNMYWDDVTFSLPAPPDGGRWHLFLDTSAPPPHEIAEVGGEPALAEQHSLVLGARSLVVLVSR